VTRRGVREHPRYFPQFLPQAVEVVEVVVHPLKLLVAEALVVAAWTQDEVGFLALELLTKVLAVGQELLT
jgi:hypothetical protein